MTSDLLSRINRILGAGKVDPNALMTLIEELLLIWYSEEDYEVRVSWYIIGEVVYYKVDSVFNGYEDTEYLYVKDGLLHREEK